MSNRNRDADRLLCGHAQRNKGDVLSKSVIYITGIAIVAIVAILLSSAPTVESEGENGGGVGLWYQDILYDTNDLYMTASIESTCGTAPEITIPNTVTDPETGLTYTVTDIGLGAFDNYEDLEIIHFEKGCQIVSIGDGAFVKCKKLHQVDWHNLECLEKIVGYAFRFTAIEEVYIPSTVQDIFEFAFSDCASLTTLTFGEDSELSNIYERAFNNCSSLEGSIVFPSELQIIGNGAFCNCSSITSISLSACKDLQSIDAGGFWDCVSLQDITFPEFNDFGFIRTNAFGYMMPDDQPYQSEFANYLGGDTFILPGTSYQVFEDSRYHRDSTDQTPFTRVCDVSIEGVGSSTVYAGTQLAEPQLADRPNFVFNGWYWDDMYWSFEDYYVIDDMTLRQKWTHIEEGTVVIDSSDATAVRIDLQGKNVDVACVEFSNGKTIILDTSMRTGNQLFVSMYELMGDRVEIVTENYAGYMTVTLPVDLSKGTPKVYFYDGDNKVLMESITDYKSITFVTDHNSTYGIEYEKHDVEGASYGFIAILVALAIVMVILAFAGNRR